MAPAAPTPRTATECSAWEQTPWSRVKLPIILFHFFKFIRPTQHVQHNIIQAVGGRPPQYAHSPLLPLWAPKRRSAADPTAPADGNVAVDSHAQYVPTLTAAAAWRVNAAVSKAAWWLWSLTYWPWKWCTSQVWCGLPVWRF